MTRPAEVFFLPWREGLLYDPRALEEGHSSKHSRTSTATLVGEKVDTDDIEAHGGQTSKGLVLERRSLRGLDSSSLPAKKGFKLYQLLRWKYGSVYRRIFCLAVLANILAITLLSLHNLWSGSSLSLDTASTAASSNILAAILVRNEHIVNALFAVFGTWPRRLPLSIRRILAKVYCYGGVHSGCSVAATLWYIVFVVLMTGKFSGADLAMLGAYISLVSYAAVALLCLIIAFALPGVRVRMHNWFEGVHRFMGWAAVLLFWAQTLLLAADGASAQNIPFARVLVATPTFWILVAVTLLIVYPWTRLRLRDVEAEVLSDHCVKLSFSHTNGQYGQAVRLSDAPLKETHAFAVIPDPVVPLTSKHKPTSASADISTSRKGVTLSTATATPLPAEQKGFSVLISNAGDWTQKIIRNPPSRIYTRGVPQYGVLRVAGLFSPVVIVATGSGIGPCLSLFVQRPRHPVRIIWSAPCPAETYGRGVVDLIYRSDPGAVIIDTKKMGRADLVGLAYGVWEGKMKDDDALGGRKGSGARKGECEAVVVISNQTVTRKVVYGLETRGVPAYGAIFDS